MSVDAVRAVTMAAVQAVVRVLALVLREGAWGI